MCIYLWCRTIVIGITITYRLTATQNYLGMCPRKIGSNMASKSSPVGPTQRIAVGQRYWPWKRKTIPRCQSLSLACPERRRLIELSKSNQTGPKILSPSHFIVFHATQAKNWPSDPSSVFVFSINTSSLPLLWWYDYSINHFFLESFRIHD
jgi:hypothetical protein